ncbi:mucin-6-like isoform X2 [Leguminivora glycinivorella]|uniref:mucin-6-like isoform X2 n=1 Tax=Leguminivora glycinivorella TaxID=1035111 RepID=UPI0020105E14|nr:mucin-6-like isoform X2 [Leguminivora glycinivorella]
MIKLFKFVVPTDLLTVQDASDIMARFVYLLCVIIAVVTATAPDENPDQCTKPHENWTKCYIGVCAPIRCGDLGKPIGCPSIAPPCAGGCICEHGFVRNEKGDCIDAKTCPNCGGDPNAEPGCGNPCRPTCANPAGTPAAECTTFCEFNACDCKEGYILNTDVDPPRCVYPKDCKNQAVH